MKHVDVAVVMGSQSDWDTMQHAANILTEFDVSHGVAIVSAHRTPGRMNEFAEKAADNGVKIIIAGAGGAAHLPGMIAAQTTLPVLAVPVQTRVLGGLDSLLSIVQMPRGVPTAAFSIGAAGAHNAALFAVSQLALNDERLREALSAYRARIAEEAVAPELPGAPLLLTEWL